MIKGIFLALVILSLAGCAFLGAGRDTVVPADIPLRVTLESVPFHVQKQYQCGPAALAMVLNWSGLDIAPDALVPQVYLPNRQGSLQAGLIGAARRHQRLAYPISGLEGLLQEVAAGHPVVVLQNLGLSWLPRWHYAVVIGYDLDARTVILHTGTIAFRQVGLRTFMYTWRRADQWGVCVLEPGVMPATAKEQDYLKAALGLEQAGHRHAAIRAYAAAAARWPNSGQAWLASGNAWYADGSAVQAMAAFSRAVEIDPDNGAALNNLAHLLAESGDFDRAEAMARRAVAAGGIHKAVYRHTLDEILSKPRR